MCDGLACLRANAFCPDFGAIQGDARKMTCLSELQSWCFVKHTELKLVSFLFLASYKFCRLVMQNDNSLVTNALLSQVPERHQGSIWPLGCLMKYCSMLRNRMLADPSFLFKVGTEIVIDSYCATFAEVQKKGKDFWAEFELYAADLLVGIAIDIALVGMLAPYARIWKAIGITRII
ncbi:unnamed protein product [Prunus armeniaca]|uniref:Uncharacterized protein n=1 Tax=Prunus armeniaca TaxID=36596 RepID=A0A6J5WQW8_PRUAR|nr:unnamed protein product [Prunus armeniaca]